MDLFERWLIDQIEQAEQNADEAEGQDRVMGLSYRIGVDLLRGVLEVYRAFRSNRTGGSGL